MRAQDLLNDVDSDQCTPTGSHLIEQRAWNGRPDLFAVDMTHRQQCGCAGRQKCFTGILEFAERNRAAFKWDAMYPCKVFDKLAAQTVQHARVGCDNASIADKMHSGSTCFCNEPRMIQQQCLTPRFQLVGFLIGQPPVQSIANFQADVKAVVRDLPHARGSQMYAVTKLRSPCFKRQLKRMHGSCRLSPSGQFAAKVCRIRTGGGKHHDSKIAAGWNQRKVVREHAMDAKQNLLFVERFRESDPVNRMQQAIKVLQERRSLPDEWQIRHLKLLRDELSRNTSAARLGMPVVVEAILATEQFHEAAYAVFESLLWWGTQRVADSVELLSADESFREASERCRETRHAWPLGTLWPAHRSVACELRRRPRLQCPLWV